MNDDVSLNLGILTEMEPHTDVECSLVPNFFAYICVTFTFIYLADTIIQIDLHRRYTVCYQDNAHIKTFIIARIHANDRPKM